MKKTLLMLVTAFITYFTYAQNTFPTSGNAGIATTPPTIGSYGVFAINGRSSSQGGYLSLMANGTEVGAIAANSQFNIQTASGMITQFYTGGTQTMQISSTGNVGIGTMSPDQKLSVNGTIHSKSVLVDLVGWPDYVFKPAYKLPLLTEVKTYIDKNHHLPDMLSAAEVEKNGLNVGEMNKILVQKVEELTLYLIEKDKQLQEQQKQITDQQKTNQLVKQRLDFLTRELKQSGRKPKNK